MHLAARLRKHREDLLGRHGTNASILRVDLAEAAQVLELLVKVYGYCQKCEMHVPPDRKLEHLAEHVLDRLDVIARGFEGR